MADLASAREVDLLGIDDAEEAGRGERVPDGVPDARLADAVGLLRGVARLAVLRGVGVPDRAAPAVGADGRIAEVAEGGPAALFAVRREEVSGRGDVLESPVVGARALGCAGGQPRADALGVGRLGLRWFGIRDARAPGAGVLGAGLEAMLTRGTSAG